MRNPGGWWWLAATIACAPKLIAPPADSQVQCVSDADCPTNLACAVDVGRCISLDNPCFERTATGFVAVAPGTSCPTSDGARGICLLGSCGPSVCGDGFVDNVVTGEVCDDGADNSDSEPDRCRTTCVAPTCGDGAVDLLGGEDCDDGSNNGPTAACSPTCSQGCGDGYVQPGEDCDDGNPTNGDGCDAGTAGAGPLARLCSATGCGNGILTAGEICDDGNLDNDDGCDSDPTGAGPAAELCSLTGCGNGIVTSGEVCDDGNLFSGDGCDANCTPTTCGNGVVTLGEECDDGNLIDDDGCDTAPAAPPAQPCTPTRCGNGVLTTGEICDDGNETFGDGCSAGCLSLETCGNGIIDALASPPESCDDGSHASRDGCSSTCVTEQSTWLSQTSAWRPLDRFALAYDTVREVAVLFGGSVAGIPLGDATWEFDGYVWTRIQTATTPPGRQSPAMAYDSDRQVMVLFGGAGAAGLLDDTWEYDGDDWVPRSPAAKPPVRREATMVYDSARTLTLLFGGEGSGGNLADMWEYNGTTWSQRTTTTTPPARSEAAMAYDTTCNRTVLYGGSGLDDTWEFYDTDGAGGTPPNWFSRAAGTPPMKDRIALAYDGTRMVLFGGHQFSGSDILHNDLYFNSDPDCDPTFTWTLSSPTGELPRARQNAGMFWHGGRGLMVVVGGRDLTATLLGDTWLVDTTPTAAAWQRTVSEPRGLFIAAAFDEARGRIVAQGGQIGPLSGNLSNLTWEHDGNDWRRIGTGGPGARQAHRMVYEESRGRTIVFGGITKSTINYLSGCFKSDTWSWDGSTWTCLGSASSADASCAVNAAGPAARYGHAMAYDPRRDRVVLFGGVPAADPDPPDWCGNIGPGSNLDDTWEFDGAAWQEITPTQRPAARPGAAMAYDVVSERVVLYGGVGGTADTQVWLFDGDDWQPLTVSGHPGPQLWTAFAPEPNRGSLFLTSGTYGGELLSDLYELRVAPDRTSAEWSLSLTSGEAPVGRYGAAWVHDAWRRQLVLFGGFDGGGYAEKAGVLRSMSATPDEDCEASSDADGDGLIGCNDPDCAPTLDCTCGNLSCDGWESSLVCPGDCP